MNQPAMIPDPRPAPSNRLELAAAKHIEHLRGANLIGAEHELLVELVLHLARAVAMTTKAYALANLSKELREAIEQLPAPTEGDAWENFAKHLASLTEADQ